MLGFFCESLSAISGEFICLFLEARICHVCPRTGNDEFCGIISAGTADQVEMLFVSVLCAAAQACVLPALGVHNAESALAWTLPGEQTNVSQVIKVSG